MPLLVERRGIVSVEGDIGREECWPKRVNDVLDPHLHDALKYAAQEFIRTRKLQGEEYVDAEDIHVYGPFPTPERLAAMLGNEEMAVDTRLREQLVLERAESPTAFSHYLLNAGFTLVRKDALKGASDGTDLQESL